MPFCHAMTIIILLLQTLAQSSAAVGEMHGGGYTMTQNEDSVKIEAVFETIRNRRTVRQFNSTPVPQEHIMKILDAARYAPTAGNVQPWKFVVIQDPERLDSLCQILQVSWKKKLEAMTGLDPEQRDSYIEGGQEAIRNVMTAPVYIIVFVDTTAYPRYALYDGCLAVGNLMIAARALGYGTGFFTTYFPESVIKDFVNAPADLLFVCATPVGVPKAWPETPPKKDLNQFIVHEHFEEKSHNVYAKRRNKTCNLKSTAFLLLLYPSLFY